ncbi:protein of unknown function [Modestobacter italicus]|uniref:SEFIR domain-containing protein n=1 Tax=Modestobacter italicus (strain DSM 44449 / CECT 9708 / BC 501) TaxID=2732864 RepID=I4EX74_MODI5|nr:hypothetical protein [Modestobacter marinus]CCH87987.1 protein of unknown function [Modestobacter marinus]
MTEEAAPTALISWAHDSDAGAPLPKGAARREADELWLGTVLDLVTHLRTIGGVDADIDFVHGAEPVDWSRWGPEKVRTSDFVLVAVNKAWIRRFSGTEAPTRGAGATAEADELLGLFETDRDAFDRKVILVLLPGVDAADIPNRLRGRLTRVRVDSFDEDGLDDLLRRIYGKPKFQLPPVRGNTPALPPTHNRVNIRDFLGEDPATREGTSTTDERSSENKPSSRVTTAISDLESRLAVVTSGLRALSPDAANDGPALPIGRQWQYLAAERARIDDELQRRKSSSDEDLHTVRFMWVEGSREIRGYQGDVDSAVLQQGWIEPNAASEFPGPSGKFRLMPPEHWETIDKEDPAPIFLHESYVSRIEKWIQPISNRVEEVRAIAKVRDAVIALVDSRVEADPRVIPVSSTVTTKERSQHRTAVVGRAVVISPA